MKHNGGGGGAPRVISPERTGQGVWAKLPAPRRCRGFRDSQGNACVFLFKQFILSRARRGRKWYRSSVSFPFRCVVVLHCRAAAAVPPKARLARKAAAVHDRFSFLAVSGGGNNAAVPAIPLNGRGLRMALRYNRPRFFLGCGRQRKKETTERLRARRQEPRQKARCIRSRQMCNFLNQVSRLSDISGVTNRSATQALSLETNEEKKKEVMEQGLVGLRAEGV